MHLKTLPKAIIILNAGLILLQLIFASKNATFGDEISSLDQKYSSLLLDNIRLEKDIYTYSSIASIQTRAEKLGFILGKPQFITPPAVAEGNLPHEQKN